MAVYRIDEPLGEGGFAYVYRARDVNLDIDVALKVLKPAFAYDEVFEESFRKEAQRAATFRHPNVIAIHYAGKDDDIVFFSMDLLEKGLKDLLKAGRPVKEEIIIGVGIDVASALQFAHTHEGGIVHRDLKPDNILFDRHGNAVVTDFGIAEAASHYTAATGTTVYVGTPKYMSPEQARGHRVDHRSDIYSLGVTLYEMATGEAPFSGRDWFELGRQHIEKIPPLPHEHNPKIDAQLERIILKCLQKNPADRYQTAERLRDDLKALGAGTGRAAVLAASAAEKKKPRPAVAPASAGPSDEYVANWARRHRGGFYDATTQPAKRRSRLFAGLTIAVLLVGTIAAYALDLGGFRVWGEGKLPALAGIPLIGTGTVYATSFLYATVEGGADLEPELGIGFSGPIDPTTASRANVKLIGPDSRQVPAEITVTDGNRRIVVKPSRRLEYETDYVIRITGGLLSARATPIKSNPRAREPGAEFEFRTRLAPPDTDPPFLAESTPKPDAKGVPINQPITLTFNEALDPNTVSSESVQLYDPQGNIVDVEVLLRTDFQTVHIQPLVPLSRDATYKLRLASSILDRSGNPMLADSLVFSTGPAPPRRAPARPALLSVGVLPEEAMTRVKVELDGKDIGNLPKLNVSIDSRKRHTVRLFGTVQFSKHTLLLYEESFVPRPGQNIEVKPQIKPFGSVTVGSEPIADVFINGKLIGPTPVAGLPLFAGQYQLELHPTPQDVDRYGLYSIRFEVRPFERLNLGSLKLPRR